jgi:hypothetical protein
LIAREGWRELEAEMRFYAQATGLFLLTCVPANSQEQARLDQIQGMEVGRGVICDTAEQVQHYVNLRGDGKEADAALKRINQEAHKTTACTYVLSTSKPLGALTVRGKELSILEITVHAFNNGSTWMSVPATVQYTVVAEKVVVI